MYREKVLNMLPQLSPNEVRIVSEMVENAVRYSNSVTNMEAQLEILPYRYEGEELREAITKLDIARRRAHDAFIARIKAVNRICEHHNLPVFYDGPEDRALIGDCAFMIQREYDSIKNLLNDSGS